MVVGGYNTSVVGGYNTSVIKMYVSNMRGFIKSFALIYFSKTVFQWPNIRILILGSGSDQELFITLYCICTMDSSVDFEIWRPNSLFAQG